MKIGIVSSYFYPWYGGITEHVYYQYKELKRRGHQVKLITPFDGMGMLEHECDLIRIGKPITFFVNGSIVKIPIIPKKKSSIEGILNREHFDIIHFHQPLFCLLSLSFLRIIQTRRRKGLVCPKIVGTFHATGGGAERFLIKSFGFYFRQFRNDFNFRIAVSQSSRDFVNPILPDDFSVIPNGVDIERFAKADSTIPAYDDGVMNILFVGRLEPRKGLTSLLESMPLIQKYTNMKYRLLVVGNGMLTNYYKKRIPRDATDKVVFTGGVSFEDLPRYYKTAHVFCSPATYGESFGIVLIEAMAAGLPVVAGNNEGYRNVIQNGINGFLVNPEDPEAIAKSIGQLLNSENERTSFGQRNKEACKQYGWASIMNRVEAVYGQN